MAYEQIRSVTIELEGDSPYPEVRSAVANTDDPEMAVNTFRVWFLGLICAIVVPGLNQFLFFRFPSVGIGGVVVVILTFPVGRAWATYVPEWRVMGLPLNPGPFTVKEHVLITANVGGFPAYGTAEYSAVAAQRLYYRQNYNFSYQWFMVMSSQLIGYSMGGIARRFLVDPPSMIWPGNLVTCVIFNTLHSRVCSGAGARGGLSRERFFAYAFLGSFAWLQALSYFSWITWIRPNDPVVAQLFGYVHGMGMSVITFDWSQIAYAASPLVTPWWAQVNVMGGFLVPVLYFTNTWFGKFMPISSNASYDNQMNFYNVSAILTPELTLDLDAYHKYSPLFISSTFAMAYGLSFASISATLIHALLYFRKHIWVQLRRPTHLQPDIHARLMQIYPQVPGWWYAVLWLSMLVFGIISIEVWPTGMPVWALVVALVLAFTYIVPVGMIEAMTSQQVGLNVLTELIAGYAVPGHPIAVMMFKTCFTSDFKLGHYMKIPPQVMFWCQIVATTVAATVQLGVQTWMFANIENVCSPNQKDRFICPGVEVFGTASIIGFTEALLFFPLIGVGAPLVTWILMHAYPDSALKYINPLIFGGLGYIPPATALNYVPAIVVGFVFQYLIRRQVFAWSKYNFVLAIALDSGVAFASLVIFFGLQFPRNGLIGANNILTWWGNTLQIPFSGADYGPNGAGTPVQALAPGETFG
ncbi:OPT oligopeptide transporter protein-domain-containing protein [Mycena olivaceomarginata]|nr:OPT oligopeptide transporter protein-domain-containing protein [Mycena olivaceomarginata]